MLNILLYFICFGMTYTSIEIHRKKTDSFLGLIPCTQRHGHQSNDDSCQCGGSHDTFYSEGNYSPECYGDSKTNIEVISGNFILWVNSYAV